jgi:hypothetical protein
MATVVLARTGYRVRLPAAVTFKGCRGEVLTFEVAGRVESLRWTATYPEGSDHWLTLTRPELCRPAKTRRVPRSGDAYYGGVWQNPDAPDPDSGLHRG